MWLTILSSSIFFALVFAQVEPPDYDWDTVTPLDAYVHSDDGAFKWNMITYYEFNQVTVYIMNMTSQYYMDCNYVTCCEWWHFMGIAVPDQIDYNDHGVLFIGGGSNRNPDEPPNNLTVETLAAAKWANDTGTVVGYILQVPNQPCVFRDDPTQESRTEDETIAWTWRAYLDDPLKDPTPILRLPMTKAAKRGLDTIHEFTRLMFPQTNITKFAVAGASKRGWTTWSLAATDKRIVIAMPLVMSFLYMNETAMHHYRAFDGGYSFALKDYWNLNITADFNGNPEMEGVYDAEDMIRYRARLTMPKLMVSATGDEFFLNQDSHYWWDMMTNPKFIMMNPNCEHTLFPHWLRIYNNVAAFWLTFLEGGSWPVIRWSMHEDETTGHINMHTNPAPDKLSAFKAVTLTNNTRRDYRLAAGTPDNVGPQPIWWRARNETVEQLGGGNFRHYVDQQPGEWVAHFLEGEWMGPRGFTIVLTSEVNIVPDTYPAPPCVGEECRGILV